MAKLGVHFGNSAIIHDEIIGSDNWAAFFKVFDFALITFADLGFIKGTFGADGDASVAEWLRGDDGDERKLARELVFQSFIFGPGVDAIEDDAFLAGGDKIFSFGNNLANDPIFTFVLADLLTKIAFVVGSNFDATFGHFF